MVRTCQDNTRVQQEIIREKQVNVKFKMDQEDAVDSPQVRWQSVSPIRVMPPVA